MGFGSLEAALTTTADATDCIACGLGRAGAGAAGLLMADFLERLYKKNKTSSKCQ
jgi:hypothetical protein